VRAHLVDTARTFIFDTGLAPACAGAARAALRLVDGDRVGALRAAAAELATLLELPSPHAAVLPLVVVDPLAAAAARDMCARAGVAVGCFRPPSVPEGGSCLRLTAHADLTRDELRDAARVVLAAVAAAT
jgi:8-amino-7-oxononanoate synthase